MVCMFKKDLRKSKINTRDLPWGSEQEENDKVTQKHLKTMDELLDSDI